MSTIFKSVVEGTNKELAERYQALMALAEGSLEHLPVIGEITKENLDNLELHINREIILQQLREELDIRPEFHIDSQDAFDWYLKKRLHYLSEIESITTQYDKLIESVKSKLANVDRLYQEEAKIFANLEYQKTGKKTMVRPYGTARFKETKPSWKVENEKDLQSWLGSLTSEERAEYNCQPATWTRDLDAIKERAEKIREKSGLEKNMGLVYSPGGMVFSLSIPKEEKKDAAKNI